MMRFYLKFTLVSFILLSAVMVLIRAQPYDDHELRALLLPEGCEMPCFMGIRPGVTTADEAIRLLQASEWTNSVNTYDNGDTQQLGTVTWRWNDHASHFLSAADINTLSVTDNIVENIYIWTSVPFGEMWLTLGTASQYGLTTVSVMENSPVYMLYDHFYADNGLGVGGHAACSYLAHLWDIPSTVYYMQPQDHLFPAEIRYDAFFRRQVLDLDRQICKG
jgi:hypothetical protein